MQINLTNVFTDNLQFVEIEETVIMDKVRLASRTAKVKDHILLQLGIEKVKNEEFLLTGFIKTTLVFSCDRCNEPAKFDFTTNFSKEVLIGVAEEDDESLLDGYNLDLEKLVLNEIYLNFPMKVLCKKDCKGICEKCGTDLNLHNCNCEDDRIDPRLEGLKALFDENFKEV